MSGYQAFVSARTHCSVPPENHTSRAKSPSLGSLLFIRGTASMRIDKLTIGAALAAALLLSGCATLPSGSKPDPRDRFERANRSVYAFNTAVDHKTRSYLLEGKPARPGSEEADDERHDHHCRRDEDEHADAARTGERRGDDVAGKYGGKAAEGIDEPDPACPHRGGKQLALVRVVRQGHQRVADCDKGSNRGEHSKVRVLCDARHS